MNGFFSSSIKQGVLAYNSPPHRFINREYFVISYETDPDLLRRILPPGLVAPDPIVKFEFMNMPDAGGFGLFSEAGQAIPVLYDGIPGTYIHNMYLNSPGPVTGGREIWGFPKTMGRPCLEIDCDHVLGTLDYGKTRIATGTMLYKNMALDTEIVRSSLESPGFLVKCIPDVTGDMAICQLVKYKMTNVNVKWAFTGDATLQLHPHIMANIASLPVHRVLSASHFLADLTLPFGEVAIDYLK
ncbi:acetoacetate decarboxylase [Klebsiella aerogenes]|uniref:acetoacetate decarboxylase n=1 Tax=Klebsiella aerogenes TaxID=548 RepID=UPI0021D08A1A|nr:acetoacetate decarboxylase [Klebsiella aerogenes]MCU6317007.1 acetoacetate decarboxylase [Klebsiella aerogenes]